MKARPDPAHKEAAEEPLGAHLDQLESAIFSRDAELRRLRAEAESRDHYIAALHSQLSEQADRIAALDERLRVLEQNRGTVRSQAAAG